MISFDKSTYTTIDVDGNYADLHTIQTTSNMKPSYNVHVETQYDVLEQYSQIKTVTVRFVYIYN